MAAPVALVVGRTEVALTLMERMDEALMPNSGNCWAARPTATEAFVLSCCDSIVTEVRLPLHGKGTEVVSRAEDTVARTDCSLLIE